MRKPLRLCWSASALLAWRGRRGGSQAWAPWTTLRPMCIVIDRDHSPGRLRKGMCRKHYERAAKYGDPLMTAMPTRGLPLAERFWRMVDKTEGCWFWTGAIAKVTGYGRFEGWGAHQHAYALGVGPIPEGKVVDHLCNIRHCVRPSHLQAKTQRENTLRSEIAPAAVNARKTECVNGHKLEGGNVYCPPKRPGQRHCKKCQRERGRVRSDR